MTFEDWRKESLAHHLWLLERAGPEYAIDAADRAEKHSEGVLRGLGAKVRAVVAEKRIQRRETA